MTCSLMMENLSTRCAPMTLDSFCVCNGISLSPRAAGAGLMLPRWISHRCSGGVSAGLEPDDVWHS
jgi:hypothetical protein